MVALVAVSAQVNAQQEQAGGNAAAHAQSGQAGGAAQNQHMGRLMTFGGKLPIPDPHLPYLQQREMDSQYQEYLAGKLAHWETALAIISTMNETYEVMYDVKPDEPARPMDATVVPPNLNVAPPPRAAQPRPTQRRSASFKVTEVFGSQATIQAGDKTYLVRDGDKVEDYTVAVSEDGTISMRNSARNIVLHQGNGSK